MVDWDEFGLGRRALDLIALASDCECRGERTTADRLLARAASVAGSDGLRCLISRTLAWLAHLTREGSPAAQAAVGASSTILDRLQASSS